METIGRPRKLFAVLVIAGGLAGGPGALAAPGTSPGRCIIEMNVKLLCVIRMNFADDTNLFSYELELNRGQQEAAASEPGRFSEITIRLSNAAGHEIVLASSLDLSVLETFDDPKVSGDRSTVEFTQTLAWDGNDADGVPMVGLLDATEELELAYYPNGERRTLGTPTMSDFRITNTEEVEP
jgi:hypothetical protein